MRLLVTAALMTLTATQSLALSCLRPDPVETFQRLAAAEERYFVLYGTLDFDERLLPEPDLTNQDPSPEPIPGHFTGKGLSRQGFTTDYIANVTLQIQCFGPWCGGAASGVPAVWFVPFSDPPATLQADPCGSMTFYEPSDAAVEMLESCMAGGVCTPVTE
jgi:hypothetical protein